MICNSLECKYNGVFLGGAITVFIVLLTFGIFDIRFDYFIKSVHEVGSEKVILTFDDGPNTSTLKVLNVLKKHEVGAVFFLIGQCMVENPQITNTLKSSGMVLGNHSYSHSGRFAFMTTSNICKELSKTEELLGTHSINLFRAPFGITSPQIARAVRKMGMKSIGWRVRSLDTVIDNKFKLINKILKQSKEGSIILLHESGKVTASSLDELIIKLKSSGLNIASNEEIKTILHV